MIRFTLTKIMSAWSFVCHGKFGCSKVLPPKKLWFDTAWNGIVGDDPGRGWCSKRDTSSVHPSKYLKICRIYQNLPDPTDPTNRMDDPCGLWGIPCKWMRPLLVPALALSPVVTTGRSAWTCCESACATEEDWSTPSASTRPSVPSISLRSDLFSAGGQ